MITADYALEQGKDIYAVPGRLYDQLSEGCNGLIRQGAGMISDLEEFRAELALCGIGGRNTQELQKLSLEKDEKLVYSCLSLQPKGIEEIMAETGFSVPDAAKALVGLMQKDLISESGKNKYIRQIE